MAPQYWATIFLGAFLLFAVQLVLGKYLLPWFGGTPAMWTTCMFFFQTLLLAGYAYAHGVTHSSFSSRIQAVVHSTFLLLSLSLLCWLAIVWHSPLTPDVSWRPQGSDHPVLHLILLLSASAGLPFFVLSSTGPLLQSWFTKTHPGQSPYRLYALSNLGSLLALLSYPFVIEPWLSLRMQAYLWSGTFLCYVLLCGYCALQLASKTAITSNQSETTSEFGANPGTRKQILWIALAACPSVMFLATTNRLCEDVGTVPFLWVLPLSLYLLSLIICFDKAKWYSRRIFHPVFVIAIFLVCLVINGWGLTNIRLLIAVYSFTLFICCMVCHGELARSKPGSGYLTSFYMMVSLGGAIGGVFVALIVPHIFKDFWEYHLGLWMSVLLLFLVLFQDKSSWLYSRFGLPAVSIAAALLPGVTLFATEGTRDIGKLFPVVPLVIALYILNRWGEKGANTARDRAIPMFCVTALAVLGSTLLFVSWRQVKGLAWSSRNFYGVLTVEDESNLDHPESQAFSLRHGHVSHGFQFRTLSKRKLPTAYYGLASGVGRALIGLRHASSQSADPVINLRIGVVGLGVGTLSAYGIAGDYIRFYEINPEVIRIANDTRYFTYLADCRARLDVIAGDARIAMERELEQEQSQQFDLLAIDAFSGDAIPLHLLTEEAFQIYLQEIKRPGGILAINITNAYLNFEPVLWRVAQRFGLSYALLHTSGDNYITGYSDWVFLSFNKRFIDSLQTQTEAASNNVHRSTRISLWTDDYSNLFQVLKP